MAKKKIYDMEFKIQAVRLGQEAGFSKATKKPEVKREYLDALLAEI